MRGHRERLDALVALIPTPFATLVPALMLVALWKLVWHSRASWLPMFWRVCSVSDWGSWGSICCQVGTCGSGSCTRWGQGSICWDSTSYWWVSLCSQHVGRVPGKCAQASKQESLASSSKTSTDGSPCSNLKLTETSASIITTGICVHCAANKSMSGH